LFLGLVGSSAALDLNVTAAEYHILMVGDWGGSSDSKPTTSTQLKVTAQMGKVAAAKSTQLVLLLGDNFYGSGISSKTAETRFQSTFENAFTADSLSNVPFYALAGNHDHKGDATLQVDYHLKGSGRWNMPALNYVIDETLPDGRTLRVVMFDSVVLVGQNYFDENDAQIETPPASYATASANWAWIESKLSESNADFLFTASHYPIHSGCSHGSVMRGTQHDDFMETYKVNGHLAGHDHCMMHIEENGQQHVVSGAGAANWYSWSKSVSSGAKVKYHTASDNSNGVAGGFTGLTVTSEGGKFTYYADNGDVLYEGAVFSARPKSVYV
jgi:hypothetical protein